MTWMAMKRSTASADPLPDGAFVLADVPGVSVRVGLAPGEKCGRCWRVLEEVGHDPSRPELCCRCSDAVAEIGAAH